MLTVNTQEALELFGDYVVSKSKDNLHKLKKNSSGKLSKSIAFKSEVSKEGNFSAAFSMEDYGEFQDKGVNGFLKKHGSPFSYKDKMPPSKKLDSWIVKRGIAPRDAKGKFISRKSIQFLIARSIFFNGIKPTHFLSNPFEDAFKDLPQDMVEAFALDVKEFLEFTIKENKKK